MDLSMQRKEYFLAVDFKVERKYVIKSVDLRVRWKMLRPGQGFEDIKTAVFSFIIATPRLGILGYKGMMLRMAGLFGRQGSFLRMARLLTSKCKAELDGQALGDQVEVLQGRLVF
ncbi:hypothetical protein SUGI_0122590 [Cryptomeria japonica]|nr:hypothetical protein SUGI_0122590 [Cryptomeria japonica]